MTAQNTSCNFHGSNELHATFHKQVLPLRRDLYVAALGFTKNQADAEDLVQDTLVRAFQAWDRFEPGSNCRAWLKRILCNSFINGYRRNKRRQRFAVSAREGAMGLSDTNLSGSEDPGVPMLENAMSDEVHAALDTLPASYRRVVEHADLNGRPYKDIALDLAVPIGTVMSRLHRARKQLEKHLGSYAAANYRIYRAA